MRKPKSRGRRQPSVAMSYPKRTPESVCLKNKVVMKAFERPCAPNRPGRRLKIRKSSLAGRRKAAKDNDMLVGVQRTLQRERNLHH